VARRVTTSDEARAFLAANQPFPSDDEWSEELVETVASLRQSLKEDPDDTLVSLLVNSPGERDGHGQYQLFQDVLARHTRERVEEALRSSLRSDHRSVRYWSAQYAAAGHAAPLLDALQPLLADSDEDVRRAVVIAIESAENEEALGILRNWARQEPSHSVREFIDESIAYLEDKFTDSKG
jgi:hypothetical protein